MKFIDEFRDTELALDLAHSIRRASVKPVQLMEVCGTHTMQIARHGIKHLLPENVRLISGPGCPVCVTPQSQIDRFIELGRTGNRILTTFGDMIRVPGNGSSLEVERAKGTDVRIVYSPLDAVNIAAENPEKQVIFFGVGFETTTPTVALAVLEAKKRGLTNFLVLASHKVMPPPMIALASDPDIAIDGFICPGHVSTIIGSMAYEPVARDCGIPCVISGFEPLDILQTILMLVKQAVEGRSEVEVQYSRAVSREGNPAARECVDTIFEPADVEWRGLGVIPGSGLEFRKEFDSFDAANLLPVDWKPNPMAAEKVCECGFILKGIKRPGECRAFGTACTVDNPLGPCMVSTEGACAAEYKYGERTAV